MMQSFPKYSVGLLLVNLDQCPPWTKVIRDICESTHDRLYIFFSRDCASSNSAPDQGVFKVLNQCYNATSGAAPCLDVVPLFPSAGWTLEHVSKIEEIEVLFATVDPDDHATVYCDGPSGICDSIVKTLWPCATKETSSGMLCDAINDLREKGPLPVVEVLAEHEIAESHEEEIVEQGRDALQPPCTKFFKHAAVGGTFDRLHAGHRLLLSAAALVTDGTLYVGIAGDELLAKKSNKDLMQNFKEREQEATAFLQRVRPSLTISIRPLLDASPPLASHMPEMEALIISKETLKGGEAIQSHRSSLGLQPITLVIVDVVGSAAQIAAGDKLSSSDLRQKDASRVTLQQI
ncbi:hypothetical protein CYMTET_50169 [Cymbomonas tetramitiformis]|uniref:Cytidyltransferase-like domain-containing protein n=1 Tax=Cymbomonas tetramitiformis TaxID=36881 RepID=A0AAE0BNL2_9CHLO|nr:hypothetical protein CYMTET_50169 [Cymbomonas tetramitiformis]